MIIENTIALHPLCEVLLVKEHIIITVNANFLGPILYTCYSLNQS